MLETHSQNLAESPEISSAVEPIEIENSTTFSNQKLDDLQLQSLGITKVGESSIQEDPTEGLILGKFKSVDDLSKAYEELQRHQGESSEELGSLRKQVTAIDSLFKQFDLYQKFSNASEGMIKRDREKYNSPEYFQNPTFREIYREAFGALGENLDTDRFVNLLESYVKSRIFSNERKKAAQNENKQATGAMDYSRNPKSSFTPPKKSLDEMSQQELTELIDRLI